VKGGRNVVAKIAVVGLARFHVLCELSPPLFGKWLAENCAKEREEARGRRG